MKKTLALLFSVVLILSSLAMMTASATDVSLLEYEIHGGEVEITGCSDSLSGELVIPETIEGYPVTEIGTWAFENNANITSVVIPASVTVIGDEAFNCCSNLNNVTVLGTLKEVSGKSFWGTPWYDNKDNYEGGVLYVGNCAIYADHEIVDCVIKLGTTMIAYEAFAEKPYLRSVTIPDSVKVIELEAFKGCKALETINLPDVGIVIGESAFDNTAFTNNYAENYEDDGSLYIGNHLIYAGGGRDDNISYQVREGTKSIGSNAFEWRDTLEKVYLPDGLEVIGTYAFSKRKNLTEINFPDSLKIISDYAFSGCEKLRDIKLPVFLTEIGDAAFNGCSALSEVTIHENVEEWGEFTFDDSGVKTVVVSDGITRIPRYSFNCCRNLVSLNFPLSVVKVEEVAFNGCDSLKTVYYAGTQEDWDKIVIGEENEALLKANIITQSVSQGVNTTNGNSAADTNNDSVGANNSSGSSNKNGGSGANIGGIILPVVGVAVLAAGAFVIIKKRKK